MCIEKRIEESKVTRKNINKTGQGKSWVKWCDKWMTGYMFASFKDSETGRIYSATTEADGTPVFREEVHI